MKTKRSFITIALVLVLAFVLGIGSTYAWFTAMASGGGSTRFGKIDISVTMDGKALTDKMFDKVNLLPGDSVLDYDVIAKKTASSSPFYFRVELSFTADADISAYEDDLNSVLTASNIGNGKNFVKDESVTDRAVFYYGTSVTSLTEVDHTNDIVVLDKDLFRIPLGLNQLGSCAQYGKSISLNVTVIAIQSANMSGTIAGFKDVDFQSVTEITEDGKYLYFGEYPQTLKASDVTVDTTTTDENGYYLGSDGERYAKLTAKMYGTGDQYKAGDGTTMTTGTEYYFKVERLKWRILSRDDTTALIVCDQVLRAMAYQTNYDSSTYYLKDEYGNKIDGLYANNYKYSELREWLNNGFYNQAFSTLDKSIILTTTVDNSPASTKNTTNSYACEDTEDKVFALSRADVLNTNYGFSSSTSAHSSRYWYATDYAKATYLNVQSTSLSYQWLRSPIPPDCYFAYGVDDGYAGYDDVYYAGSGVAPALQISLA